MMRQLESATAVPQIATLWVRSPPPVGTRKAKEVPVAQDGGGMPRLADRLNHLFGTVPQRGGRVMWSNDSAAAAMAAAGAPISGAYLSQMRNGHRENPSARHLAALARLFDVPMEYFFDDDLAARIDRDLTLLAAVRDAGVEGIALRAHGLSSASLENIAGIIERIRQLENLPDQPDGDARP